MTQKTNMLSLITVAVAAAVLLGSLAHAKEVDCVKNLSPDDGKTITTGGTCKPDTPQKKYLVTEVDTANQARYQYCMPEIDRNCKDQDNNDCKHCQLYYEATANVCANKQHPPPNEYCAVKGESTLQISSAETGNTKHWKLVPLDPVRGLEELESLCSKPAPNPQLQALDRLWQNGLEAVTAASTASWRLPWDGTGGVKLSNAAYLINAPERRTGHQLHIHVGQPQKNLQTYLGFSAPTSAQLNTWVDLKPPATTKAVGRIKCFDTSVTAPSPFKQMCEAVAKNEWGQKYSNDFWYRTSIGLITPRFCQGSSAKCRYCMLLMDRIAEQDFLCYESKTTSCT